MKYHQMYINHLYRFYWMIGIHIMSQQKVNSESVLMQVRRLEDLPF
jgi:hypothetical protein